MAYLYTCLFSNGVIKVGRSISPAERIAQHQARLACAGITLVQSDTADCGDVTLQAEAALIRKCLDECAVRHSSEWFGGLDFESVAAWMRECAKAEYESPVVPPRISYISAPNGDLEPRRERRYVFDPDTTPRWTDRQPELPHWPESEVMRWDMRPRDWWLIWPELVDHPCAILFASTHPSREGPRRFADWVRSFPPGFNWREALPATIHEAIADVLA
jgi:hypothetical protein